MKVLSLADASSSIGTGHVVRSLVLARELLDTTSKVLVAGCGVNGISKMAPSFGPIPTTDLARVFDTKERIALIEKVEPDTIVLDGYGFQRELFSYLDDSRLKYLVIDDNGESQATRPKAIVNVSPGAPKDLYKERFPDASLFLGAEFALIRREILEAGHRVREGPEAYAFVSFGGSDPAGLTLPVASFVSGMNIEVRVALGSQVREREKVAETISRLPNVELIGQNDFEKVFAQANLAIIAAGSTLWEAIYFGLPTIAVIVAENQISHAKIAAAEFEEIAVVDSLNEQMFEVAIEKAAMKFRSSFSGKSRFPRREHSGAAKLAQLITRDFAN